MNAPLLSAPRVEPFFFDADPGTRFSLYHAPAPHIPARGAILYVHPFAEELNWCRRMAALQSRRFAALGYAVLQIDLFGCGDSCGDFNAARWELWQRDLATARAWLAERSPGPMHLWGIRLGALLALDAARSSAVDGLILWQPVLNGRSAINQFLRQRLPTETGPQSSAALRARLATHGQIEINGYELVAPLARAIDACDAASMQLPACTIDWFASHGGAPARLSAEAARLGARWGQHGVQVRLHPIDGLPFWQGSVAECPALLAATDAVFGSLLP
ncbi:exosortase A system-associated hydrolase 2 [Massilia sp. CF038]|nr:exosortase A system-associated hydrolase 2 [Massilia sp. CF038]